MTSLFSTLALIALAFQFAQPHLAPPQMSGVPANTIPDGITVRGNGTASIAADQASVTLRLFAKNNALIIDQSSLQPFVDALVALGVARSDITTPMYLTGQAKTNNAVITAVVNHPTVTTIENGLATLSARFNPDSQILINGAEVRLTANDCSAARKQAQSAAIHQAHSNAQDLASQLGVHVGSVLAADFQSAFENGPSCTSSYMIGPYQTAPFNTPEQLLQVHISSFVTIRYAIR